MPRKASPQTPVPHLPGPQVEPDTDREMLAERIRPLLPATGITRKDMFGHLCFLLHGNLLCGAHRRGMMVRLGKAAVTEALREPHTSPTLPSGGRMNGFLMVSPDGLSDDAALSHWLRRALAHVSTLPPKQPTPRT